MGLLRMFLENHNTFDMKTRHLFLIAVTLLSITIFAFNDSEEAVKATMAQNSSELSGLEEAILSMESARFNKRKAEIHKDLLVYNKDAKQSTAENILLAIEAFDLDETEKMFDYSICQLLYESRGIHMEGGELLASSANALGIGQIKSTTAFHYLKKVMSESDRLVLDSLGGDYIKFGPKDKVSKVIRADNTVAWVTPNKTKKKVKKWMENEINSTLLWGYIMRHNISKYGHTNALVMYSTGKGTWIRLKDAEFDMNSHSYMRGIRKVEKVLNKKGSLSTTLLSK